MNDSAAQSKLSELTIEIRPAEESDLNMILGLYARTINKGKHLPLEHAQGIVKRIQSYPNFKIYVALYNEVIIGSFELLVMDSLGHHGSPVGIIEAFAVEPSFQRRGVGTTMMQYACKVCKEANCYKLVLSSNLERKQAHKFYESLGFAKHGFSYHI